MSASSHDLLHGLITLRKLHLPQRALKFSDGGVRCSKDNLVQRSSLVLENPSISFHQKTIN